MVTESERAAENQTIGEVNSLVDAWSRSGADPQRQALLAEQIIVKIETLPVDAQRRVAENVLLNPMERDLAQTLDYRALHRRLGVSKFMSVGPAPQVATRLPSLDVYDRATTSPQDRRTGLISPRNPYVLGPR
jgi:hypothetical protein